MILRITSTDAAAAAEYCLIELQGMLDPFSAAEGYIGNDLGELTVTAVRFLRGYRYVSHAITHLPPSLTLALLALSILSPEPRHVDYWAPQAGREAGGFAASALHAAQARRCGWRERWRRRGGRALRCRRPCEAEAGV